MGGVEGEFAHNFKNPKLLLLNLQNKDDYGKFELSYGKFFGDKVRDQGLKTSQDAKFYAISAKFPKKFSNKGKPLVVQFTIKHEQNIDCGGGYLKVGAEFCSEMALKI